MSYERFAAYYDSLTENVEQEKRAAYLAGLLRDNGVTGGLLLDLACGTGKLSVCMAEQGYEVIGVDASPDMLCAARENAARAGVDLLLLCQKMQKLDLYGTVGACICTLDSLNHLLSGGEVRRTFDRVSLFLEPEGLFLFDVNTPFKHEAVLSDNTFVYETPEVFTVWRNQYEPETREVEIFLDFFEPRGGTYSRTSEAFRERAYTDEELTRWLEQAGFTVLMRYEELTKNAPGDQTQRVVYLAKKTGMELETWEN